MSPNTASNVTIGSGVAFLVILSLLHGLEPEFNPPHLISEYQLGRFGWLMSLAFACLGAATLGIFVAVRKQLDATPARFLAWGLVIIGAAYFIAGMFPPDPKWFLGSLLHGIGGLVVILGSPIVFTFVSRGLAHKEASSAARPLLWTAGLAWIGLALFWGAVVSFGTSASSSIIVGWTNRLMITTYVLWMLVAATHTRSRTDKCVA